MSQATCCWCGSPLVEAEGAWWCGGSDACRRRQTAFAFGRMESRTKRSIRWLYVPTPVQASWSEACLRRDVTRVLVGGAAGPGKSKWGREMLYWLAQTVPGLHVLLLRRTFRDLDQSHLRFMPYEVEQRGGIYKSSDKVAVFKHRGEPDSLIRSGHMESDADVQNYLSSEYDVIFPDELVTFERDPMLELFSRARTTNKRMFALRGLDDPDPLKRLDGSLVMAATNPGGRGSLWVRDFFVTHDVDPGEFPKYRPERWAFFGARLDDNPYMASGYRETLENLPEMRRRQLLEGDWNAFEGQFFTDLKAEKDGRPYHAREIDVPDGVQWSAGMDWGYHAPGVIGFYAHLADGHYHRAREYRFSGMSVEAVAKEIRKVIAELGIGKSLRYISGDPAMWQKTGAGRGESIAETLRRYGLPMRKADNDRFNGAMRVHELLRDDGRGTPWLTVDPHGCPYWWRSVPSLMQDKNDPDDVDTTGDDHAYDETRYWAMSRPSPTRIVEDREYPVGSWGWQVEHYHKPQPRGVLA